MGLKNAAAYFQEVMASEVLNGLVNHILELYIDDVVTHASTEDQFVERLELIFQRFRLHNIKVSPKKCEFGMSEIEVLGHTINGTGIHFSRQKLEGVNDVTLPQMGTQLHSFLELANYFRNHVKNVHELEKPLRQILSQYPSIRKIAWLPNGIKVFNDLRAAVWGCTKLFFVDYDSPVYLHTDACNTGIGAYLFQVVNGVEQPIGFLSKSLTGAQLNWSTFEQEGFAIHQALKKFEYVLRDIKFTLRTDHRNLLYINEKASPKVLRWKIDIQQFNFDVEHIPGPDNVVADLYSRLTVPPSDDSDVNEYPDIERRQLPTTVESSNLALTLALLTIAAGKNVQSPPSAAQLAAWRQPIPLDVKETIDKVHNSTYGHGGVERTLTLLRKGVTWGTMRADVRKYIRACPCCQLMSTLKLKVHLAPVETNSLWFEGNLSARSIAFQVNG